MNDPLNNTNKMIQDTECKANMIRRIDRNICRNNCTHYDRQKKLCKRGYNFKPKK